MFPSIISLSVGLPISQLQHLNALQLRHPIALSAAVATRHLSVTPSLSSTALTVSSLAVTLELLLGGIGLMLVSALALRRLRR